MNSFMNGLKNATNYTETENGALAHKSTNDKVYDLFALGGAYRTRNDADVIVLFKEAFEESPMLALKCLFYLRDCRGGQGERRFFRVCFRWLANEYPDDARKLLNIVSEYGRWDDVFYAAVDTKVEGDAFYLVRKQLKLDLDCKTPSLLAKWVPSENASSRETKRVAGKFRQFCGVTHKEYRKVLATLRSRINIVEKLMSENRWDEIEFDKIPSRAGLIYKNAFARRDVIAQKYEAFAKSDDTKVNAKVLYPYDVVSKAVMDAGWSYRFPDLSDTDRAVIEKYWNNLPDYLNGEPCSMMCVVDTSGSMTGNKAFAPINVAIGLGMYCAERIGGPFRNHYISFSSKPQLIEIKGKDFVDKVQRIYKTNLCENTDLGKTFDMVLDIAKNCDPADVPKTLVVISDMEIDSMSTSGSRRWGRDGWTTETAATEMEKVREKWAAAGLEMPKLVYWNVEARNNIILDSGPNVSFVSGASPVLFEQVLRGVTGKELMLEKLNSDRYDPIEEAIYGTLV